MPNPAERATPDDESLAPQPSPADLQTVLDALVVAGARRGQTWLAKLLRALAWRRERGGAFTGADVDVALRRLAAEHRVHAHEGEGCSVPDDAAEARLSELLERPDAAGWWRAWLQAATDSTGPAERLSVRFVPRRHEESRALLRLVLIGGVDRATWSKLAQGTLQYVDTPEAILGAMAQLARLHQLDRTDPVLCWSLLSALDEFGLLPRAPALMRWVEDRLGAAPAAADVAGLRIRVAEQRLHRGDGEGMADAIASDPRAAPFLPTLKALLSARSGRFTDAAAAFPPAWKALTRRVGARRGVAPLRLLQWYPLALMALADPNAWTTARKFCVGLSGSRAPSPYCEYGVWAHALAVRLGDERLEPSALEPPTGWSEAPLSHDRLADRPVLAAWLGHAPTRWSAEQVQELVNVLHASGLSWKADLLLQACVQLGWPVPQRPAGAPAPWHVAYFRPRQEAWREALAAITALGEGRTGAFERPLDTLHWRLSLDGHGRVHDLHVFEPAASARGRPKALTPLQLSKRTRLDARDAAVARCLRRSRYNAREIGFDLVQAAQALVGHPQLAFSDAPESVVELVESLPVLEVRRERAQDGSGAERFVFRLQDALLSDSEPEIEHHVPDVDLMRTEAERRDGLRIVRDGQERARLIRITPAQRRVAELVAQRWSVPVEAGAELDGALRVLSAHFVLHSDAVAGEPVASDARLVAQLQPVGDDLRLTLAVRPFGDFGPLLAPGHGRARIMTMRSGVSLATERALDDERRHLGTVLDALPFLAGVHEDTAADCSWLLDDPEQALAVVHHLGTLLQAAEVVRAVEWPKGQPIRVVSPAADAFVTTLATRRDWFGIDGSLRVDEQRVLSLQQLLELLREAGGTRYVPLGEGRYLRLADALRQRLSELDALADTRGGTLGVGPAASAWLADAAPVLGLRGDAAWARRASLLERAAAIEPEVPHGLQAALRPYQFEGYVWMRRLAEAGFGAILADDMGLGKTVQTLALLLARASLGPALVVAPTSVCDNWAAETRRFAPGLRVEVYGRGDGERAARIEAVGPGDLIVVSYALLLRDAEAFAARSWASMVLDEAQALKNAAAQRVRAVARLEADFRLALTGTPVENRLADLWSIMNLLNPGLLGSPERFGERFAGPIERQRSDAARGRLRRLVSPFLLRRTKAQVLPELPPRTEIVHRIEPEPEERALLEALRREALARIGTLDPSAGDRNRFNVLAELTRLRRAACDPRLAAPELGRVGAKVREFERLAGELVASGHQVLVFSQFTDLLALLAERLDACGLRYRVLDGSTPAAARAERVAAFQHGEADLFLVSLKAGGFGLNLTAADYVIIADPWWNPAAEDQATGRAHRLGQQRPVTVYRLVTAGSIEERILSLHGAKRELAEGLLAGQDGSAPLAASELIELLREADAPAA